MIRLALNPTFEKQVPITLRGSEAPAMATFTFRALELEVVMLLLAVSGQLGKSWFARKLAFFRLSLRLRKWVNNLDLLDLMISGWDEGDSGFDKPYSKEALLLLIAKDIGVLGKIPLAYFAGMQEEREKN